VEAEALKPSTRALRESELLRLFREGHVPPVGERELRIRIDTGGKIRWFEASRIRGSASELE
jgi:hypothetical protein